MKNQQRTAAARRFAALIAFTGLVFTIAQVGYISRTGNTLCLNSGCMIVENQTRIPPIFFNLAGVLFFLVMFIFIQLAKKNYGGNDFWSRAAGLSLLLAMIVEGVLLSFQMQVLRAWCFYCLVIFACVFLLNLSLGWQRFFRGLLVLAAVVMASASLNYASSPNLSDSQRGSCGEITPANPVMQMRLYFSTACPHCEEIIASLSEDISCQIGFYPLEMVPELRIAGLRQNPQYDTGVNRALLQELGLYEVPVLMVREENETRIITGKDTILTFLQRCHSLPAPLKGQSMEGQSVAPNDPAAIMNSTGNNTEGSCPIDASCPAEAAKPR